MKRIKKSKFTLVELLIAMGIFSIILLFMMQIFSGAQRLWVNSEQKNNLYSDARVAMELMTTMLQGTYSSAATDTPFWVESNQIYFPTQSKMELPGKNDVRFVYFGCDSANDNKLVMKVWSDALESEEDKFYFCFPPFGGAGIDTVSDARTKVKQVMDNVVKKSATNQNVKDHYSVLLENVTGLELITYVVDDTKDFGMKVASDADDRKLIPCLIEIRLSLMDPQSFDFWYNELGAKGTLTGEAKKRAENYRRQHERTFTRAVYLGDRQQRL